MIPVRGYAAQTVAVLGLGRSGLAAARALEAGGANVLCWDDGEAAREAALAEGLQIEDLSKDRAWVDTSVLIVSPGIAHLYPQPHPIVALAQEKGAVIDNDVGLFFRSFASDAWEELETLPRVICVTGSNGKSTTTALIHHILSTSGKPCQMGGNIGVGVLDLEPPRDGEIVVLELSSYQTELARALAPDVAVFLNLSPDHLDRHGGHGGYFAAKRRLFTEGSPDRSIIGLDEVEGRYLANLMREHHGNGEPVITLSNSRKLQGDGWSVFARKGFLVEWRRGRQMASIDLRGIANLPGAHNHQNACAAYAACRSIGLAPRQIEAALASFPGLPHRAQQVADVGGVRFVNDSKATNADAAEKALMAFDRIRWIAGGVPKAGGIAGLAPLFDRVLKTYLIGDAAEDFAAALGDAPHEISQTLEAAFAGAVRDASPGEVILLSPACASFDQFKSFEARGDAFVALVQAHEAAGVL